MSRSLRGASRGHLLKLLVAPCVLGRLHWWGVASRGRLEGQPWRWTPWHSVRGWVAGLERIEADRHGAY